MNTQEHIEFIEELIKETIDKIWELDGKRFFLVERCKKYEALLGRGELVEPRTLPNLTPNDTKDDVILDHEWGLERKAGEEPEGYPC